MSWKEGMDDEKDQLCVRWNKGEREEIKKGRGEKESQHGRGGIGKKIRMLKIKGRMDRTG